MKICVHTEIISWCTRSSKANRSNYLVNEQVLWFQVSVKDIVTVAKCKTSKQLVHESLQQKKVHTCTKRKYIHVQKHNIILIFILVHTDILNLI